MSADDEPSRRATPDGSGDDVVARLMAAAPATPRYRLLSEPLESDGASAIVRVWDVSLARELAMKVSVGERATMTSAPALQLVDEALQTGQLSHPGIVPVHDLGVDEQGHLFFTMRLIRGNSLADVIAKARLERDVPLARTLGLLLNACDAVAYAHSRGVAHGDLRPENIRVGDFGETYVTGWGLGGASEAPPGEPSYLAPERALGSADLASARADIYSVGAILHHVLADRAPPPELAAICAKAMARDADARYASMQELAADLRAHLEQRVVQAHRTGALAEFRKWVARNRATAVIAVLTLLAMIGGLVATLGITSTKNRELAVAEATARRNLEDVTRLKALKQVRDLVQEADTIWPAAPAQIPAMRRWLAGAEQLVADREVHRVRLHDLESRAEQSAGSAGALRFADPRDAWWHESLAQLSSELDALRTDDAFRIGTIAEMQRRLANAQTIEQRSIGDRTAEWSEAIAAIGEDPRFGGLELTEQVGLVPIGPDPASGLWEFWHVESGAEPLRDPDTRRLQLTDAMGMVFILLPGGGFRFGARSQDPAGPNDDAEADASDREIPQVTLDPFFISKFEMTQAQWQHVTGQNPSWHRVGQPLCPGLHTPLNPVESISWRTAMASMRRLGLSLPTCAQWEYAARAGTTTLYWTGNTDASVQGAGNVADRHLRALQPERDLPVEAWDDGFACTAPIGSFRPNAFGLHDTIGNVSELSCEASYRDVEVEFVAGTGERRPRNASGESETIYFCGGAFIRTAHASCSSSYGRDASDTATDKTGLRPVRRITH